MNRLGIVMFYDKEGVVDDYLMYFLEKLRPFYSELCVVVNEFLTPAGKEKFETICDKLIIRKNEGMDVMAYKEAIESYGFENIKQYDELLLTNYTNFWPFYPLSEMYDAMDKKKCDLWSVYRWPIYKDLHHVPETYQHLPSFFMSYRQSLLKSTHFKEYWQTLHPIVTYQDSSIYHEQRQTPYFERLGFKGEVYIDNKKYESFWRTTFPFGCILQMIKEDRCPFIKRRQFFIENGKFPYSVGNIIPVLKFLKENRLYDIKMIRDSIVRTQDVNSLPSINKNFRYYKRLFFSYLFFWKRNYYLEKIKKQLGATVTKEEFLSFF